MSSIVPLLPAGKYGETSSEGSSALSMIKSHGSGIFESHLFTPSKSGSSLHNRAMLKNPCSAVSLLLASIQKIPQKLDGGQRSIQLDETAGYLKSYVRTFGDEFVQISNILEFSRTPLDHTTQTFSGLEYYLRASMASRYS